MERTYTVDETAEIIGVSSSTIRHWAKTEELAANKVSKNPASKKPRFRFSEEAIQAFLNARSTSPLATIAKPPATIKPAVRLVAGVDYAETFKE